MKLQIYLTAGLIFLTSLPFHASALDEPAEPENPPVFFEDFDDPELDPAKWLIAETTWEGIGAGSYAKEYNGGVIPENVSVADGKLILAGHGNRYEGDVRGIDRNGNRREDGKRSGAAIATRQYFNSGRYEIRAKAAPEANIFSSMFTLEAEESYNTLGQREITMDSVMMELPAPRGDAFHSVTCGGGAALSQDDSIPAHFPDCPNQADGEFHTYRFDWYTSNLLNEYIEYFVDDNLVYKAESRNLVPKKAGRFWLALYFSGDCAKNADFDTTTFEIDWIRITPCHRPGDKPQAETYPDRGWALPQSNLPDGWLLWQSSDSIESRLFLRAPDGKTKLISDDFYQAQNGSFGRSPNEIVFTAIDRATDEWDIFRRQNGEITNLTQNSGFRNKEPKWSPDCKQIVFQRGRRDDGEDDFQYDLALLDPDTGTVTMLTDDAAEQAMPCFSADGNSVYYTEYSDGIGAICRMDLSTRKTETIYSEPGVNAYDPIVSGNMLYFTAWHSAENHHDRIMQCDGENITEMPFNAPDYDCSYAGPAKDGIVFSSTKDGSYDLYYFDGTQTAPLTALNMECSELGTCFFPAVEYDVNLDGICSTEDVQTLGKWLSQDQAESRILASAVYREACVRSISAADLNRDGVLNAVDLSLLKRRIAAQ